MGSDRPLRVALVTSSYNYIADGVALTLNRLVGYLESHGVEVHVFAPIADRPAFEHQGTIVPVPSIPLPGRPEYRLALGMAGFIALGWAFWRWEASVSRRFPPPPSAPTLEPGEQL